MNKVVNHYSVTHVILLSCYS